jgi:hypothetical protein
MGWLAGFLASAPAMMVTGWRDSERDPRVFATIIGFGLLAWGAWTLLLALGAWLLFALPAALFIPPAFLVRHRRAVLWITILATVAAVAQKMRSFQDLAASHVALRFVLYMPYGAFACFFAVITAWWYIRGLRRTALDERPLFQVPLN